MLYATFAAIVVWSEVVFTLDKRTAVFSGANIEYAIAEVFVAGLLGLLLIGFLRRSRRALASLLLLEAAVLAVALILVALDGATYKARYTCDFLCFGGEKPYTETYHVWYLYFHWGLPLVLLLAQAARVLREGPLKPDPAEEQV
jgi:hypothetical protein